MTWGRRFSRSTGDGARLAAVAAFLALVFLAALSSAAFAQTFPRLTGRVVDAANLLTSDERTALDAKLKAHEDKTTDQIVVATVPSLEATSVEDYANRLFRHWEIGQKAKNNGALLLVAPNERKVRIEVGYGLEGALTDALSKVIITTAIAPQFQKGDFAAGIGAGLDAMLSILTGDAEEWQRRAQVREDEFSTMDSIMSFLMIAFILFVLVRSFRSGGVSGAARSRRRGSGPWIVPTGGGWSGGGGWSSGGSGGFSGGGGSSGGGGASGSW